MARFRKIHDIPPTIWTKESLVELAHIAHEGVSSRDEYNQFTLSFGDADYTESSIESAFESLGNKEVDSIDFKVMGWNENNEIENSLSVSMDSRVSQFQISSTDEIWFLGRVEQLNALFISQKPWYSFLSLKFPQIAGSVQGVSFVGALLLLGIQSWYFAAFLLIINFMFGRAFKYYQDGRLFPKTHFFINRPNKKTSNESITLVLSFLVAIATILGVGLQIWSLTSQ